MAWPPPQPQAINLKEGFGGVVDLDYVNAILCPPETMDDSATSERIEHMGMTDLISCVGMYIPLEGNRLFIAHIDADTNRGDYFCDAEEGQKLKTALLDRLANSVESDRKPCPPSGRTSFLVFDQDW